MEQVKDFFSDLLSTAYWPPRWHCGKWSAFHGWLYILSDLAIWSAYFAMPAIIIIYISKRKHVRFHPMYFLFAAFILACGTTHLLDAITFWYPVYRLNALVRFIAGVISWITVFYLIKVLPAAFSLKSAEELEAEVVRNKEMKIALEIANDKLNIKVKELENANTELEQFAYISSHDLQEPLRKIQTFISLMAENKDNEEKFTKYYNKVFESSARMKKLITELLSYSKLSQTGFRFDSIDLNETVEEIKSDFEVLIDEKNVLVHMQPMPPILGIKTQITQLFSNLLNNAIKFCDRQPVIHISAAALPDEEVKNNLLLPPGRSYIKITFQDNGIGFKQEFAAQIFKMFQRLNNRDDYEGTGIGLAVCKKIVDNHGGTISATSEPGAGTTFTLILPLYKPNADNDSTIKATT